MILTISALYCIGFVFEDKDTISFGTLKQLDSIAKKYSFEFRLNIHDDLVPEEYKGHCIIEYSDSITDASRRTEQEFCEETKTKGKAIKSEVLAIVGKQTRCIEYGFGF